MWLSSSSRAPRRSASIGSASSSFPTGLLSPRFLTTSLGFAAAHFKVPRIGWVHVHLTCMLASVYILVGGGVNEVFLRVNVLRRLVPSLNSPIVGMTHLAMMISFAMLIIYFNLREWRRQLTPEIFLTAPPSR